MSVGRNDPCPCGSGKKYKKCCLNTAPDPISSTKQKLNRFHDRIVGELVRHAGRTFGPEGFEAAEDEFFNWREEEELDGLDLEGHETVFYPWFLFKWRNDLESEETGVSGPEDEGVVSTYLRKYGRKLDPLEREYLEGLARAPLTFFQVTGTEPGKSVAVHDLLLGCDHLVLEESASRILKEGDVVFGSVVSAGGISLFGAMSMIAFSPSAKVDILAMAETMARSTEDPISEAIVEEYDIELRDLYLHLYARQLASPALRNTDGDELVFHTLKYTISSPQAVFEALKGLTGGFASEEDLLGQAEYDARGELYAVEIPWLLPGDGKPGGMDNILHGRLYLHGTEMRCEVNSAARAERLRDIIARSVPPGDAVYRATVIQSLEAMTKDEPPDVDAEPEDDLADDAEAREHIDRFMRRHWEKWPDMELPALQGRTPRQAVRDELGRRQVAALLEDAERSCRQSDGAMGSMENFLRVRRELGFDK